MDVEVRAPRNPCWEHQRQVRYQKGIIPWAKSHGDVKVGTLPAVSDPDGHEDPASPTGPKLDLGTMENNTVEPPLLDLLQSGLDNFGKQLQCGVCMEQFSV